MPFNQAPGNSNGQEGQGERKINESPQSFNLKDTARIAELNAKFEGGGNKEEGVDVVALNNRIVNAKPEEKSSLLKNLSNAEVNAVVENIIGKDDDFDSVYSSLSNFDFKVEIIENQKVLEKLKAILVQGVHPFNIQRIFKIVPNKGADFLSDPSVRNAIVTGSINRIGNSRSGDERELIKVISTFGLGREDLRKIADGLQNYSGDGYRGFVEAFGADFIYPELRR